MPSPQITTQLKRKKKPHEKFIQVTKFGSTPSELTIEAKDTTVKVRSFQPNPKRYSFGKIPFLTATIEFFMYPETDLNNVLMSIEAEKTPLLQVDIRKCKELTALINKVKYFQSLTKERKLIYLQNHYYTFRNLPFHTKFANVNVVKEIQ
jgi:hypothetical protein